jgi:hypothetical protein
VRRWEVQPCYAGVRADETSVTEINSLSYMYNGIKKKLLGEKPALVPLIPPQILHLLPWATLTS